MTLRTGLVIAVLLGTVTTAGYGLWKGFWIWLLLRSVWGLAWSLLRMGGYLAVIAYSDDTNRGHWMGRYNGVYRLGSLFGMLLGGVLVPFAGLHAVALAFGSVAFAGLPLIGAGIPKRKAGSPASGSVRQAPAADVWSGPVPKAIATGLLLTLIHAVFTSTLSLVIGNNFSDPVPLFGLAVSGTALAGALQAARWSTEPFLASWFGRLSDGPKGRLPLFALSLVGAAAGYALVPWPLPLAGWIAAVLLVMVTGTALTTLMDAIASDAARTASVVAVMTAYSVATDFGAALGPVLTYALASWNGGLPAAYLGSAAVLALLALWHLPRPASALQN